MNDITKHFDVAQEILELTNKELKNLTPVNILIAGKSGVGKSTLINSVFREKIAETGMGQPITRHLQRISRKDVPITIYDTRGLELSSKVQEQVTAEIHSLIDDKRKTNEKLHVAYYCIQATSSRIEEVEIKMIKDISKKIPVILVLTQAIGEDTKEFKKYLKDLNLPVVGIHRVLAQPYRISEDYVVQAFGLEKLIERTFNLIPKNVQKSLTNAQRVDIKRKVQTAKDWAKKYTLTTFGVGFTPIPFSDATVLVPMQVTLLAHITVIFGVPIDRATIISIIAAVGGTGTATFAGRTIVSNAFKFIPGVGTVVGGFISGTTASIVTHALANSYIQVLKVIATNELTGVETPPTQIIKLMEKHFKKIITENRRELRKESKILDTKSKIPSINTKIAKKTVENFINRFKR